MHNIREMRIEIHRAKGGKVTGATVHHMMMPSKASKSGAFMEEMRHSFPFGAGETKKMAKHISEHLGGDNAAMDNAKKAESDVGAVDDGRNEG